MSTKKNKKDSIKESGKEYANKGFEYTVARYGKNDIIVEKLETGILTIDLALNGGIPLGRLIEIYGLEGSGKTTFALQIINSAQEKGLKCAFIDMERTYTPEYANHLGIKELILFRPDYGEQAFQGIIDMLNKNVKIIVVDSVASLIPKAEVEETDEGNALGLQARMMSRWIRKIVPLASENNATIIFINQIRSKINTTVYGGNPETTIGGMALRFYSSVRISLKKVEMLKGKSDTVYGHEVKFQIVKNKLNWKTHFNNNNIHLIYERGFCKKTDMLRWAERVGIISWSGSWIKMKDETLGQGLENIIKANNIDQLKRIEELTRKKIAELYLNFDDNKEENDKGQDGNNRSI